MVAEEADPGGHTGAAIFDFDGTLVHRDCFVPWLAVIGGWARVTRAGIAVVARDGPFGRKGDFRTRIKAGMVRRCLTGVAAAEARSAARELSRHLNWRRDIRTRLERHQAQGHRILIATGSPSLLVGEIAAHVLGVDQVIGTELGIADGRLTGELVSPNCIRAVKRDRVAEWLARHEPIRETWGYGNAPHDLPMLSLLDHAQVV